jgi:hypothetical protein
VLQVPTSLAGLLSLLAPAFSQPSFRTFSMLMIGFTARARDWGSAIIRAISNA